MGALTYSNNTAMSVCLGILHMDIAYKCSMHCKNCNCMEFLIVGHANATITFLALQTNTVLF